MKKLIKTSTVPMSLDTFCRGQLKMLSEHFEVVAVSSPDVELKLIEEREGVKTISVPMERHISILKDVVSLFRMVRVFRKEKPDIVHSITPKAGLISMLAAWICRVPVRMHTYTGLVFPTATGIKQNILILMDRLLCRCATYINPEGRGVANDLKRFGITKKPLHIIGNGNVRGIDADYWTTEEAVRNKIRRQLDIDNDFVFLFVGRLVGDKGINELIAAFKKLCTDYESVKLLLVGHYEDKLDPLKPETMQEIKNNQSIITTGSQKDVRPYYAASDAFVFPSYREGFPNTVLEAGALGLPSIVTDINGANEIIVRNKNGVIVPSKNSDALYEAMCLFLNQTELLKQMAANARSMVIDRFEQKYIWGELLKVYQSLNL
jgi:glycosyltransferase involved in cell wall biosynthesis